jgi:glutaredoxin 3
MITIYGQPTCSKCRDAKALLERKNIDYTYHDLTEMEPAQARAVIELSGMRTVPIVKVDEIYIGGYDQLEKYLNGKEV